LQRSTSIHAALLTALLIAGCGGGNDSVATPADPAPAPAPAPAPPPAPTVEITGAVDKPAALSVADLGTRAPITQTVTYASGSGSQTRTYTGASLWALLNEAGIQTDASRKSDLLNRYVVATGGDGYRALFSLGELSPDFGNRQNIVAYAAIENGNAAALPAADGPFRVTAPTDTKGGRYVSNLVKLEVRNSAAATAGIGGGPSASFVVSGQVAAPATFDVSALKGLAASTQTVGANTYTGVSLWTLLNSIGLKLPAGKNASLSMYAVATGSDGYRALVSLGEADPSFGNNGALVAYEMNGAALTTNGSTRLVVPGEVKQGRSVSNLIAIEVMTADAP